MRQFSFENKTIEGVVLIKPFIYEDDRGMFIKDFETELYKQHGFGNIIFNEEFYSISKKNVIRGLHFQTINPQAKIVSCMTGAILDVVVDLRKNSKTFGKYLKFELSESNRCSLFIPKGCAHGFLSLKDNSITCYKCVGDYSVHSDSTVFWNDPDIGIDWPVSDVEDIIINERDRNAISFKEFCDKIGGLEGE